MANFQTHLGGAALGGGFVLSGALVTGLMSLNEAIAGWCLVMIGGILPDIDSDHSNVVRALFSILGGIAAVLSVVALADKVPLAGLWLAGATSFIAVRYGIWYVFARFTVHRGIFHSLLAGCLFAVFTAFLAYQAVDLSEDVSWLMGISLLIGYLIHLLLDECYSVDLTNARIKRSFGTAFKLFDYQNIGNTILMFSLLMGLITTVAPPITELWYLMTDPRVRWSWQKSW
ncbi:metal-dependent hydrolase [Oceanospirillum sp.]|uniref:metal-dependent hydrolase n=1 Tax=Oceanospirillum sp. TaxID=2021254 RepID=UPI003A9282D5